MSASVFQPRFAALPREVAVFPLPGALLLPGGHLPLNIFEPRYLEMTFDALGAGRMFAMIQPRDPEEDPSPLYSVACLGRIVRFAETDDGRLLVTLEGVSRFQVGAELPLYKGYRRVEAEYGPYADDLTPPPATLGLDRPGLFTALKAYAARHELSFNWKAIEEVPEPALVNSLAMACPFEPSEKQALLEAETPSQRAELLTGLLRIGAASSLMGGTTQ
ncbi:peptidase S16 [Rhodospirillum rubrum]|uniref:LON peptidase substrate-binding domain-containing protein n=1 Tax=Rhodospirillum rubrum TaxID=1085 RepID=UPI001906ECBB|nr:LON peptidase substrate-binding domain-containing protein [Rhodospirillum rubrum]MBK1663494.1 peptidase S16 [Rhodospirillum rubrum]MBK1675692.1 peptidase S16 [Rhodospirillum rubrum]